jgi:predicted RNA-binding protein Jag
LTHALKEAEKAATEVKTNHEPIELSPQGSYIRRLQHLVAERSKLNSKSVGREPERHVTFYPED